MGLGSGTDLMGLGSGTDPMDPLVHNASLALQHWRDAGMTPVATDAPAIIPSASLRPTGHNEQQALQVALQRERVRTPQNADRLFDAMYSEQAGRGRGECRWRRGEREGSGPACEAWHGS